MYIFNSTELNRGRSKNILIGEKHGNDIYKCIVYVKRKF